MKTQAGYSKGILAIVMLLGMATLTAINTNAQTITTDPVGFFTWTAYGTAAGDGLNYFGLGLTQVVTNRGVISAVSGTQVTVSNLTAGAFNMVGANPTFFIEVTSNGVSAVNAGLFDDIVSNDTVNVFTAHNDSSLITAGQTYKIYPHWTIAKVFGATDQAGLQQGAAGTADQILVPIQSSQGFAAYYYATATKTLTAGWKNPSTGNTDQSATPLYIDQGFLISKKTTTNLTIQLVGAVKLGPTIIPLAGTNNFTANVYASSAMTLGTSGLYNGGNATNSLVAGAAGTADQVLIHNDAVGGYAAYYYATATKTLTAGWKNAATGNTDASGTSIPLGANVLIKLQAGRNGFNWVPNQPY